MVGRQFADIREVVGFYRVSRERLWDLIEHPLIDHAGFALSVSMFKRHQRLPEKFAHLSVNFARPELVVIEKNLKTRRGFFIVIRKRHKNLRRRFWRRSRDRRR